MRIYLKLTIVFLTFIIIPVFFVSYMIFYNSKNIIEKEIFSKLNNLADEEKEEVESFFLERQNDLQILEQQDIYKSAFPSLNKFYQNPSNPSYITAKKAVDARFSIFVEIHKYIDIALVNMEGRIIYSYKPENKFEIGTIISDKDAVFNNAKSDIYIKNIHENNSLSLADYIYDDENKIIGIIFLDLDANLLFKLVQDAPGLGITGEALLVKKTPNNNIKFLHSLKFAKDNSSLLSISIGSNYALPAQKAVLSKSGSGQSIDYRGIDVLSAWRSIKYLNFGLVIKIDSKEAFLPIKKLKNLLFIIILVTILSTVLAALTIAKSISNPISNLHKGIEIIGNGDLDYKVGTNTNDEIGQLSRAFDSMTTSLKMTTTSISILNKEITERKQAEHNLRESEEKYKRIFNNAILGLFQSTPEGKVISVNNAFAYMFGYDSPEDVANNVKNISTDLYSDPNRREEILRLIGQNPNLKIFENVYRRKDGSTFFGNLHVMIIKDVNGKTIRIEGIIEDITERKKSEEKIKHALAQEKKSHNILISMLDDNNQIREKLEKKFDELKRAQNILIRSEKMASLGKLVSEIAHEINNPLMIISGYAQIPLMSESLDDEAKNSFQIIIEETQKAKNIIRRLLKFSKPSKGEISKVNINKSLESFIYIIERQFNLINIEIKKEFQKNLLDISINEQQMHEVFMNLLNNAKDSILNGGTITIKTSQKENFLRIDFMDTGVGMSEDTLKKLFDPFFTTKPEGTGLGMVICHGIISAHNGKLTIVSELNKGTTVTILLPFLNKEKA